MKKEEDLHTCNNHGSVMVYRGDKCPWCAFTDEMIVKLQKEYRRGFADGVKAADLENAKHPLIQYIIKEEVKNESSDIEPGAPLPSGRGPGAGGGDSEGPEEARSVDECGERGPADPPTAPVER